MANVRVVVIDFQYKKSVRAELQVMLCEDHWTPIKTIAKDSLIDKVVKAANAELVKIKFRATLDKAIDVEEQVKMFEDRGEWREAGN